MYDSKTRQSTQSAYIRQASGLCLDLVNPSKDSWTDEDLAIGLARTYRWGGHSTWRFPLSVAQHSLTVLALYGAQDRQSAVRELTHDAEEALIGGFDPITGLKPMLGSVFRDTTAKLQAVVADRYCLAPWTVQDHTRHKHCDTLAAASEAYHVAGWSCEEIEQVLRIGLKPLDTDPLAQVFDCRPWEPWPMDIAAERFLAELKGSGRVQHGNSALRATSFST